MKKLLILLILLMPCNALANTHTFENKYKVYTKVICVEGYKYLITRSYDAVSTVQMMQTYSMSHASVPIKCK